ncbi:Crp/Fnr family transcriptional regulator [Undibacterium flavidum]|uniref:Cyclic nucleotide-binding domain-containing protein n=1 Tax=Undibacterium flavidum TaxID=2762297 RepID=A0ABR6YF53_9BURK|nr:cyclic nucleotide-binding domain-containing protein [Undibacterium flavidum]MBC3875183.1 cyclic nucleotide-binding domain-containing protein [Undibacterium flavidum]
MTSFTITGLTTEGVDELLAIATMRKFSRNAIIVSEGDDSDSVYFIVSGSVKVFLSDEDGNEVIVANIKANDYFGEMALEEGYRSASVMAVEPVSLAIVSIEDFKNFLRTHPDFVFSLLSKLIRRTRVVTKNFKGMALLDVYGRLAELLTELAEPIDQRMVILNPLTQQEMANRIGCSREMVSKILKDLSVGGYLTCSRRQIEIKRRLPASW